MAKKRQKKFIQEAIKKPGALRKDLGTPDGKKVNVSKARAKLADIKKEAAEGDATPAEKTTRSRLNLFLNVLRPAAQKRKKDRSLLK